MDKKLLNYFNGDELAAGVWLGKYAVEGEETPNDMHKRMAKEFARIEYNYILKEREHVDSATIQKLSGYGEDRLVLNSEELPDEELPEYLGNRIYNLFKDFKYIVPQGSIMSQLGAKSIGSLSNCFVIGQPEDSYGGIFEKDEQMAQLMKRRGGVGLDISSLRPKGTPTSNAAKSSTGAISFMNRFSNTTREVAQNGRRGALMLSISINHPDVLDFIKIKRDLSQVTGANISIKLNNEFMKAVENDEDYLLKFPCDIHENLTDKYKEALEYNKLYSFENNTSFKKIKAKEYWDEIIKSAHNVAEPGLMFEDNHLNYSPDGVYPQYKGVTTNPCGEIFMQPYDACRLIAVNLFSLVDNPFTNKAKFNFEKFYQVNYEAMRLSDDLIDLELEHIDRIIAKLQVDPETVEIKYREIRLWNKIRETASSSRRTGLGFTALGDALAALNLKYDSDEALAVIDKIMSKKMESELDCTTDLAILRGPFTGWDRNIEFPLTNKQFNEVGGNSFYYLIYKMFPKQATKMSKFGRRNVSWSTVAPTGTVSLLTQTTSGLEPLFMPYYMRRKKVNPNDKDVRVDFTDQNGDTWQEFPVLHPKFKEWYLLNLEVQKQKIEQEEPDRDIDWTSIENLTKEQLQVSFQYSPWYGSTANDIDWVKRVEVQGIIQKYISHSISSTINLPENVSEDEVSTIYLESWKQGLKGVTVYREGSRSGVLVDASKTQTTNFEYKDAPKRPKSLPCDIYTTVSKGVKWNVIVGLLDSKPYEVFAVPYFTSDTNLNLVKVQQKEYNLQKEQEVVASNITAMMTSEEEVITRLISTSLRHGADIKFIVEQLNKSHGDITSFNKAIARNLKKYIPDGAKATVKCRDCGSDNVIFEEGCHKCLDCGSTACG